MSFRLLGSLPLGLRQAVLTSGNPTVPIRRVSRWTQRSSFPSFFERTPIARYSLKSKLWWLIPAAGGIVLYSTPRHDNILAKLWTSPTLIPPAPKTQPLATINAPAEEQKSILSRILCLLREKIWEPVLTGRRFIYLCFLFLPVIFAVPMVLIGRPEERYHGDRWGAVWWYELVVAQMQRAGPTFIKLSQWAASRADLFPAVFCERMGALHSSGHPHPIEHTKRVIEKVFQRRIEDVFEEFDETPIGTGAIAQVYRATLKKDLIPPSYLDPKRHMKTHAAAIAPALLQDPPPSVPTASVAIKVLHPRVAKTISRDLSIMKFFAHLITLFPGMEWLSLPEEVEVFGGMMFQQLDLRHEAENLLVFEKNFAPRKVPVMFPRPLKVWSTPELLVEEHVDALPLETLLRNGGGPFDDQIATVGLDAFLNMLLLDNFVHSDLHPGNVMIKFSKPPSTMLLLRNIFSSIFSRSEATAAYINQPDYSQSDAIVSRMRELTDSPAAWREELTVLSNMGYIPEIVFIDAGLVTTLDSKNRQNFLDLFRAVAEFDGYRTGQLMVERCRSPEMAIDTETFALKMQHIVLSVKRKTFSLGQIKISDILTDVLKAVRVHHVKMEGDFINTVISILLLEGIGRQLDPGLDLFKSALPILRQLGRQMTAQETLSNLPRGNLGTLLKVWVLLEARELASSAVINADDLIKYDWLVPGV
ncbi:hypothetical protein PLICRDRAFT_171822 [Plicaturopsis crispa FD-325 SS-3]|nr:hypothetical protein PLICRDRAFT_171822 [Plicaturopsis crispa FD-325 SS-3]